jgi:Flp pilus assembly protein TadG
MLAVMACCGLLAVAIGKAGVVLRERQQAQTAADAAALAGTDGGRSAAQRLAVANGAALVAFARTATSGGGWTVSVTASVNGVSARARASNGP